MLAIYDKLLVVADMVNLRPFLSDEHQHGLRAIARLLDDEVGDPLYAERIQRIHTQIIVGLVLRNILRDLVSGDQVPPPSSDESLDLRPLVEAALQFRIIGRRESGILLELNRQANEAKHQLFFIPRVPQ